MLGLRHCEKLGLIKRMDVIHTGQLTKESIKAMYKTVFTGLGKYHNITKWLHTNGTSSKTCSLLSQGVSPKSN